MDIEQHVVEGHDATRTLGLAQPGAGLVEQGSDQAQAAQGQRAVDGLAQGKEGLGRREEGMGRRRRPLLLAVVEGEVAIEAKALAQLGERVGGAEQFVPLRGAFAYRCLFVGRAVERPQRTDQVVGDAGAVIGPEAADLGIGGQQCVGVNGRFRVDALRPARNGEGLGKVPLEQACVGFRRIPLPDDEGDQCRGQGVAGDVAAPEIVH